MKKVLQAKVCFLVIIILILDCIRLTSINSQNNYEDFTPVLNNVSIVTQDLENPLGVYMCDREGRLYYSPDALKTFQPVGIIPTQIYSLILDPFKHSIIYACDLKNLYISTNSGKNWSLKFSFPYSVFGKILVNNKREGQILLLGCNDSGYLTVFLSNDRGQTFATISSQEQTNVKGIGNVALSCSTGGIRILALTGIGLLISDDFGKTWNKTYDRNGLCVDDTLVVDPVNPAICYFSDCCKLFQSIDYGSSWTNLNVPFYSCGISSLAVNPIQSSNIVAIDGSSDIYCSNDSGKTWQLTKDNARRDDLDSFNHDKIISLPAGNIFIVWDPGFAESFVSYDGGLNWENWEPPSKVKVNGLSAFAVDPENPMHIIVSFYNGIAWTFDGGKTWYNKAILWCPTGIEFAPSNHNYIYVSSGGGSSTIAFSQDNGKSWKTHHINSMSDYKLLNCIAVDPNDEHTIYCSEWGSGRVYVSNDSGNSFNKISVVKNGVYCVEATTNAVYAGTLYGIFVSYDKGQSWQGIGPSNIRAESISVSPVDNNTIFAGTTTGVYVSTDGGKNWEIRSKGLKEIWIHRIKADPFDKDIVYAVSNNGYFYISYNKGQSWNIIDKLQNRSDYIAVLPLDSNQRSVFTGERKYTVSAQEEKILVLQIGKTSFTVNGETRTLDSPPVIKNNRTLLPIRAVVEALGGTVGWDATERKVTVSLGSTTIELWIGKSTAKVNGVNKSIDSSNSKVVPEIINGRTMLPLRFVTENLGCTVQWDGTTKTITIIYNQ